VRFLDQGVAAKPPRRLRAGCSPESGPRPTGYTRTAFESCTPK